MKQETNAKYARGQKNSNNWDVGYTYSLFLTDGSDIRMTEDDYTKAAVELADGWHYYRTKMEDTEPDYFSLPGEQSWHEWPIAYQPHLDTLAAQLVRQVDVTGRYFIESYLGYVAVLENAVGNINIKHAEGPDRTMNTIKAIVDSGVLK